MTSEDLTMPDREETSFLETAATTTAYWQARAEAAEARLGEAEALLRESVAVYNSWPAEQPDGATWWQRMADATAASRLFLVGGVEDV